MNTPTDKESPSKCFACAVVAPMIDDGERLEARAANSPDIREIEAGSHQPYREAVRRSAELTCINLGFGPPKDVQKSPQAYIDAIRATLGPEIATAELRCSSFGYVVCTFMADDPDGEEYAEACRDHGPQTWHEVTRSRLADHLEACEIVAGWYP